MKKRKYVFIGLLSIMLIIIMGTLILYSRSYRDYKNNICNIDINGCKTKGVPYSVLNSYLQSQLIYGIGNLSFEEALSYDYGGIVKALMNVSFKDYIRKNYSSINFEPDCYLDEIMLGAIVKEYNDNHTYSINAYYELVDNQYIIIDETYGDTIDYDKFANWLIKTLKSETYLTGEEDLTVFYERPEVTADDLKVLVDELNQYAKWQVSYINGDTYGIDAANTISVKNNEIIIDESFITDIASQVYRTFTITGAEREFLTSSGDIINISGGTWGKEVWKNKEIEALTEAFYNHEILSERTPIYVREYDEIGDTYVEVNIEAQHCWVYKDGVCVMDTDIVTGKKGKHDTPKGIYYVVERVDGKYLIGDTYKTWVDKWMRLTWSGIGLHDASWRKSFGNTIYETNGSHGCINLPITFAYNLYDMSYIGMPVIIY